MCLYLVRRFRLERRIVGSRQLFYHEQSWNIGIYLGGGAANCIRSLDTYGMPVNYFIHANNGVCIFESIEWPDSSQTGIHVFAARNTTILASGAAAAGAPKPTLSLKYGTPGDGTNDGTVMSMKLIVLSLG